MREVFIDESCQNGHHYMVQGALVVPGASVADCEASYARILTDAGMLGEAKWTKVSRAKLGVYHALAAEHFQLVARQGVEFHAMIVDASRLDHAAYNQGDSELGFNKFLFRLLWHRVGIRYGRDERIVVHLDSRTATRDLSELTEILNYKAAQEFGSGIMRPAFARVAFRDSKNSRILQIADLLTGAVAWHKNDHDAHPNPSGAKLELANAIARMAGRQRLGADTPRGSWALNVWNIRLGPRGRGAR